MKERVVSKLSAIWMTTAVISLILPVFLPSYPDPHHYRDNVIDTATITMFTLSLPSSLLGLPLLAFSQLTLGIDPFTISGKYFMVIGYFVLGVVQWFSIVPWIFRKKGLETLGLSTNVHTAQMLEEVKTDFYAVPTRDKSPVEEFISKG